jgi:hypothetical protein
MHEPSPHVSTTLSHLEIALRHIIGRSREGSPCGCLFWNMLKGGHIEASHHCSARHTAKRIESCYHRTTVP